MSGERMVFRRQLFGGFDRHDVMEYIEKLAAERNAFKARREQADAEHELLVGELETLRGELDRAEERFRELGVAIIGDAESCITTIEDAYGGVREDFTRAADSIKLELDRLYGALSSVSSVIAVAGDRLVAMRRDVSDGDYDPAQSARYVAPESVPVHAPEAAGGPLESLAQLRVRLSESAKRDEQ